MANPPASVSEVLPDVTKGLRSKGDISPIGIFVRPTRIRRAFADMDARALTLTRQEKRMTFGNATFRFKGAADFSASCTPPMAETPHSALKPSPCSSTSQSIPTVSSPRNT